MTFVNHSDVIGADVGGSCKLTSSSTVRESPGKRPNDMDDDDAPCAKRRCDKISAQLKRFTISGDDDRNGRLDMDTDSEDEQSSNDDLDDDQITGGVVEEPAEDDQSTKLHLNDCLQRYLEHMKQSKDLTLPSRGVIRGNELIVWRPLPELRDPFSDPSMKGRIQEVDSAEDTGEVSTSNFIVEADDSDIETDMSSQPDSPQLYKLPMEEVIEEDVDIMDMECD